MMNKLTNPAVTVAVVIYKEQTVCHYLHIVGKGYIRDMFAGNEKYITPYEAFEMMLNKPEYTYTLHKGIVK